MQRVKAKLLCKGKSRSVLELCQHFCLERAGKGRPRAVVAAPGESQFPTWFPVSCWLCRLCCRGERAKDRAVGASP